MIPGISLVAFIQAASIFGVGTIIFAESGLLIGFFLPGDSLLFTMGFLIHTGAIGFNIHLAVLIMFLAAALGDSVGYGFGRRIGPRIFKKQDARLFKQEYIQRAQKFYQAHGSKTIVLARFIPIVRTFTPIVAGAGLMPYRRFVAFNLIGAFLWTAVVSYAGYFLSKWFEAMGWKIDTIILPIVVIIIVISVLPPAIHIFKDQKTRQAFWNGTKRELSSIFGRHK